MCPRRPTRRAGCRFTSAQNRGTHEPNNPRQPLRDLGQREPHAQHEQNQMRLPANPATRPIRHRISFLNGTFPFPVSATLRSPSGVSSSTAPVIA